MGKGSTAAGILCLAPARTSPGPNIDWTQLPAPVMGHCIRTIGTSPDVAYLAMAVATALGAVTSPSLVNLLSNLNAMFHTLRTKPGKREGADSSDVISPADPNCPILLVFSCSKQVRLLHSIRSASRCTVLIAGECSIADDRKWKGEPYI
jgi:hypothetical protein